MKLEIKNLNKRYDDKKALNDMNLVLEPGIYGLLGKNGAGKSTFMNILTDNIKRTSGEILLDGKEILDMGKEYRKLIGYMPQQQGMYDQFTAKAFLYYIAALKAIPKKKAKEDIEKYLELVNLSDVANKKLGGFSGGMRQRVMFAATMLGQPQIYLLDEPTAGLDPEERIRIRNYISKLSGNNIVILATHVVSDIECIADKLILMKEGNVIAVDRPRNLIESVEPHVYEKKCDYSEMEELNIKFNKGNVRQGKDGLYFRVVMDVVPDGFSRISGDANLEDVYLYYL